MKKYNGKQYQGKLAEVTIIRQRPPAKFIEEIKKEHPDILTIGQYLFFFSAHEARPVKRRFSLFTLFYSSYLTVINRQEGEVASLRRWWKIMGENPPKVAKNLSDIDLAGNVGWEPIKVSEGQWPHDCIEW